MEKAYNPSSVEGIIYNIWQENKCFFIDENSAKKTYTIVMPPPNITGALHMGHALDFTLQDILARYKRMSGFEIIWIPGTDHAAIATEAKVVENLQKNGITKESLGYDGFMQQCWEWKEKYGAKITEQIRKMGASCDWSKERFTLDRGCSRAVNEFFVRLYKKGLIYRGEKIVNWCPHCNTSISDIEVEFKESDSELIYLKYFLESDEEFLTVATTRPETIFGDVALAINPGDERYNRLIGKKAIVPISGKKIEIISDEYVDESFGTGVLKVTPAHDFADFEIGERHNLEQITVIDSNGRLNKRCIGYSGMTSFEARNKIINDLKSQNLLVKVEKIKNNVGKCSRCDNTIEPLISTQWFLKMDDLVKPAIKSVEDKKIKFIPGRFSKIYMHWMNNIKDWCISRQLWWGHKIPAWYCQNCGHINVSTSELKQCEKCHSEHLKQDENSLDTWFSSALWPFSALGWPNPSNEFAKYYPTDTVITGYDIIFFWVARMIFSSIELTRKIPFENIVIHGLVRDSQGRKMSKSLGNGIDPMKIIKTYGADALRLSLVTGLSLGNDMKFSEGKIEGSRNFINKIWNAARFLKMNEQHINKNITLENMSLHDSWMLSRLNDSIKEIKSNMEKFEFGISLQRIYSLFWDEFCDWYLEICKIDFRNGVKNHVCHFIFSQILKLLHPFIPFVTEKIWEFFGVGLIMKSDFPHFDEKYHNQQSEIDMKKVISLIKSIRTKRNEMNTPNSKKIKIFVNSVQNKFILEHSNEIKYLANVSEIIINFFKTDSDFVSCTLDFAEIIIPVEELTNKEELEIKLKKEIKDLESRIQKNRTLLKNEAFMKKAPEDVIQKIKSNLESDELKYEKIKN